MRVKKIRIISKAAGYGTSGNFSDYRPYSNCSHQERIFAARIMKPFYKTCLLLLTALFVLTEFMSPQVSAAVPDPQSISHSADCTIDDAGTIRFPPHKTETSVQFTGQLVSAVNKVVFGDPAMRLAAFCNFLYLSAERYLRISELLNVSAVSTVLIFPFHYFL